MPAPSNTFEECPANFAVEMDEELKRLVWTYCKWRGTPKGVVARKALKKFIEKEVANADAEDKAEFEAIRRATFGKPLTLVVSEQGAEAAASSAKPRKKKKAGSE